MPDTALYKFVYENIRDLIQSGKYPENASLPSERYLCEEYHVSRSTVRQALNQLKDDGFVFTVHGNGTFVKPQMFEQPLGKFYSFTDTLKCSNILIRNDIIGYEQVALDRNLAQKLHYPAKSIFHKIVRLRSAKDYPLMLETTYLPKSRFIKINTPLLEEQGSLYAYLRDTYAFQVSYATEACRPVLANRMERELLQIPASVPCILLERFGYEDDLVMEYTKSVVRGDKYIFKVELNPHPTPYL